MKDPQGTRQKSSRNFGIRLAPGTLSTMWISNYQLPIINKEEILDLKIVNWKFASRLACWGPQLKYPWQLFIKNTAPCELARGCIGGDAWPMPEGQMRRACISQRWDADSRHKIQDSRIIPESWILNHDSAPNFREVHAGLHKPWWMSAVTIGYNCSYVKKFCYMLENPTQNLFCEKSIMHYEQTSICRDNMHERIISRKVFWSNTK